MKRKLFYLFLLLSGIMQGQNVNIPDTVFKAKLLESSTTNNIAKNNLGTYIKIDANNDGEIQVVEALAVWELDFSSPTIYFSNIVGIEMFTNVRKLKFYDLWDIVSLDFSMLANLEEFILINGIVGQISFSGLQSLKHLSCPNAYITSLNLSNVPNLEYLDCKNNPLTNLNVAGMQHLKVLKCGNGELTNLDLSGLISLEELECYGSYTALNFSDLVSLKTVIAGGNFLTLDVTPAIALEDLQISASTLSTLNLGYKPNLTRLFVMYCNLTTLDVSGCPSLQYLQAAYNPLTYLNLKNGNPSLATFNATNMSQPVSMYICTDEGEEQSVLDTFFIYPPGLVNVNSYCTFTPGGNYNTISGRFAFDVDNNGCTTSDPAASFGRVSVTSGSVAGGGATAGNDGDYQLFRGAGTFTLTPQVENNSLFVITPASAVVNFADSNNNTHTQNFCITPNGSHPDAEISMAPYNAAHPGFSARYMVIIKNNGNQVLSGNFTINYDDSVLDYITASEAPATSSPGSMSWSYANLLPFETHIVYITYLLNGPMDIPAVNNGDSLYFTASVTTTAGDETPGNNIFNYQQISVGSYDPNDITCLQGDTVHPDKIGGYLHYNINFENTGTAPATFIVVKDVINVQQFDVSSFQLLDASHNVQTRITANKVEFIFDDINLSAAGKGNVVFKIKTLPTLAVNSTVKQKADIFFDYNWPIATNDANTTFAVLSAGDFSKDTSVKVYPNPAKNLINISADSTIQSLQLYDVQGRLLQAQSFDASDVTVDVSGRQAGIYFIKIITDKGSKVEKVIKE